MPKKDFSDSVIDMTASLLPQIARTQQAAFRLLAKEAKKPASKKRLQEVTKTLLSAGLEAYEEHRRQRKNLADIEGRTVAKLRKLMKSKKKSSP